MSKVEALSLALRKLGRFVRASLARATFGEALSTAVNSVLGQRRGNNDLASIHAIHYVLGEAPPAEVFVFYSTEAELNFARCSGATKRIEDLFLGELAAAGVKSPAGLVNRFEFDSHENVLTNFGGSYFLRMR